MSVTCRSLLVRSVDQRRIFWLFMFEPNQHLDARLHDGFFPEDCVFCTWVVWVHSVGILVGISPSEYWHGIDRDWWRTLCKRIVSINYAPAFSCGGAFCDILSSFCADENTREWLWKCICGVMKVNNCVSCVHFFTSGRPFGKDNSC